MLSQADCCGTGPPPDPARAGFVAPGRAGQGYAQSVPPSRRTPTVIKRARRHQTETSRLGELRFEIQPLSTTDYC